jgi:TolA-binding protein
MMSKDDAEKIGTLKARADWHSQNGEHKEAADAHSERGNIHLANGEKDEACDAFKTSIDCFGKAAGATAK